MSQISSLAVGTSAEEEAPLVLRGRNDVPLLWSCGFLESEIGRELLEGDVVESFFFTSTAGAVAQRFAAIARHLEEKESEYVREAWAGCAILAEVLARVPADAPAVLDANEVAGMVEDGAVEANLLQQSRTFAELRATWNPRLATSMTHEVRRDVLTGTLPADRTRARRAMGTRSGREGFFTLLLGSAQGPVATPINEWLAAAPAGAPLRPLDEEAHALADTLAARGLLTLPAESRERALRFLETAAQYRSPDALQEILTVLYAHGFVTGAPAEVPVFEETALREALEVLGD